MATYLSLKTEVATLLIDAPAAVTALIGTYVNRAIYELQNDGNFEVMKAQVDFTTTAGSHTLGSIVAADRFKELREKPYILLNDGSTKELVWLPSLEEAYRLYAATDATDKGEPRHLVLAPDSSQSDTRVVYVFPFPDDASDYGDGEYRVTIPYYKFTAELSGDSDSNWFTANAEPYIIARAAAHGFMADWDEERAGAWFQLAENHKRVIKNRGASESISRSRVMTPRADVNAHRDQRRRT